MTLRPGPSAPRSLPRTRPVRGILFLSLAAGASAFVVSTAYTTRSVEDAEEALPSRIERDMSLVAHATVLGSDLEQVEEMLSEATEGHPWEPGAMRRALAHMDREEALTRTAYARGAEALRPAAALDSAAETRKGIETMRGLLDAGKVDDARAAMHSSLRPELHAADAALKGLLQETFAGIAEAAAAQGRVRRQAMREALLVDALCVLVTLGLGALAYRSVRKQHEVLRAQLAELELFADRVAHDIRGPLTPVAFALHEASRQAGEPLRALLARGERSLRVVTQIVDGLHDFARSYSEPDPRAHSDVRSVVENVIAEATLDADAADVQLAIGPISEVIVACEDGVLASIVSNLVRNGIRYMDAQTVRRVTVSVRAEGERARILVSDTGPGLPPGFEDRAFLPYARPAAQKRAGLGLGLATVKRLSERVGGSVRVDSTASGCTFAVDLPIWQVSLSADEEALHA